MKNLIYIFLAIFSITIIASCSTNFEELNTNPDAAKTVPPELIATQVLKDYYRFWQATAQDFSTGNLWNKHTTLLESTANPSQYFFSYNPYGSFGSYKKLTDLQKMVDLSKGTTSESSYKALALFLKASYGFSATLDMGDVPYSEAGRTSEGIYKPKYDKQSDVFVAVLNDFKAAELLFAEGKNFSGDIMYNGDATKWRKLCNTMQLKVLQTISKKITPEQKNRFAAIVAANNLMTSNADSFKLIYTENPNASHPFYNGESRRLVMSPSKLMIDELKNLQDRRLFIFAEPAVAQIKAGKLESDFAAYEGAEPSTPSTALVTDKKNGKYSLMNRRYVDVRSGDPMLRFSYSEQCFIIAEAIEEGWITGDAKAYYENGVKAILTYYKDLPSTTGNHNDGTVSVPKTTSHSHGMPINAAYINSYFTGAAAYATAGTKTDRLHQIWIQKWFIDFFQGNGGNYAEYLRTGFPDHIINPATSMNPDDVTVCPKRWKYPTDEQISNPVNYNAAIDALGGFDGINVLPWYLQ